MSKEGVHRTHCCVRHGCKYGDENCPVVTGRIKQQYSCEDCQYDDEQYPDKARLDFFEEHSDWFRFSGTSTVTMDGSFPRWHVWTPKEGRTYRKTLRDAIDAAMGKEKP